jgi:hypothetical protein
MDFNLADGIAVLERTSAMRTAALNEGDVQRMQAWAGQSAALGSALPAGEKVRALWEARGGFWAESLCVGVP